tara:strand:+ start:1037 stop:1204 length:168 start_codon:yes stop_codon:yes gene_type:complete
MEIVIVIATAKVVINVFNVMATNVFQDAQWETRSAQIEIKAIHDNMEIDVQTYRV